MRWPLLLPLLALTAPAHAHEGHSGGDNNRTLKLSVIGGRVRLAYTVFYGPGTALELRKGADKNSDSQIDTDESDELLASLAASIASTLEFTIDNKASQITWDESYLNLGEAAVAAQGLTVDLISWTCLPGAGRRVLGLRDGLQLEHPGKHAIHLESDPDVDILATRMGDEDFLRTSWGWNGSLGPLAEGLRVRIDNPSAAPADRCPTHGGERRIPWLLIGGAVLLVLVGVYTRRPRA